MNVFPRDFPHTLTGFGGDPNMDRDQHRACIEKTPVILIHGNAGRVDHPQWGWDPGVKPNMRDFLRSAGYKDCEIWAMNYLGEHNNALHMVFPVRTNIDNLRSFIDAVIAYLNVERVDIICHSLGGMMATAYMRGYTKNGAFDNTDHRLNRVGTAIYLSSNNYGMTNTTEEFQIGSNFEINSHKFEGVNDDSPRGLNDTEQMISDVASWKVKTIKDVGELPPQIKYVAIRSEGDFVDNSNNDTGRLTGADLNNGVNLGSAFDDAFKKHELVIKDRGVFNDFIGYLDKYPPVGPVSIKVDKDSGNHISPLSVNVNVNPIDKIVSYVAKRVTKEYLMGSIIETVLETLNGNLTDGQTLTIPTDGIWGVTFSSRGANDIERTYGISVTMPMVEIITPNTPKFTGSLEVQAKTSSGKLYFSFDGEHFNEGSTLKIVETRTVYFIAIDNGNASEVVSRHYEKNIPYTEKVFGTPTEHYIAGRITLNEYITVYGPKYQWVNQYRMYKINGKWTDNPETPITDTVAPTVSIVKEERTDTGGLKLTVAAVDDHDAEPIIYWTTDGSPPTVNSPRRANYVDLVFNTNGKYTVKFFAKNRSGLSSDIVTWIYTVNIPQPMPDVTSDRAKLITSRGAIEYGESIQPMPDVTSDRAKLITSRGAIEYGESIQPINVTLRANRGTIVYYTTDGLDPTTKSPSFTNSKQFPISKKGGNIIKVLAIREGNPVPIRKEFNYSII